MIRSKLWLSYASVRKLMLRQYSGKRPQAQRARSSLLTAEERQNMLKSCDTFVALPPATSGGYIVFGKNSDRPSGEVQEVVCFPSATHPAGSKVKCTYIEIAQVEHTYAVVLSRPAWMWGAEMGANEHGVAIGNEAIWTKFTGEEESKKESLLGMDYLRLALERSKTSKEALETITNLLAVHGQGGRCFEDPDWAGVIYCNSFLIADRTEAWVLETAGRNWVAQKIKTGVRNISNAVTIGVDFDLTSKELTEVAKSNGWWNVEKEGPLNFRKAFAADADFDPSHGRVEAGKALLEKLSKDGSFDITSMFTVLRDPCFCMTGPAHVSVGSQVSCLPLDPSKPAVHWFTATPNPARSLFKPFTFNGAVNSCPLTTSPDFGANDPVQRKPRFMTTVDRRHPLYRAHEVVALPENDQSEKILHELKSLEKKIVSTIGEAVNSKGNLFEDAAGVEMKLYAQFPKVVSAQL